MTHTIFSVSSILLLLASSWGAWNDYNREWKKYQRRHNDLLLQRVDPRLRAALSLDKLQVKQIVVDKLNRVDRCVTCHIAYDNPAFSKDEQPLRQHPPDVLKAHPVEKYGCTICHGGQGTATTYNGAAHDELEFWEEPMWRGEYIQSACGKCHKEQSIPGAPMLSIARVLYKDEFSCDVCHKIDGEGSSDGLDLSHIGSKPLHSFDFSHIEGKKNKIRWFVEHFRDPQRIVPGSEMPPIEMTDEQSKAMTILLLSLTNSNLPSEYLVRSDTLAQGAGAPVATLEAQLLEGKRCLLCHTLHGRGGKVGPELSQVARRRNADWLFQHFKHPRTIVPGSTMPDLHLTDEEANDLTRYMLSLKNVAAQGTGY